MLLNLRCRLYVLLLLVFGLTLLFERMPFWFNFLLGTTFHERVRNRLAILQSGLYGLFFPLQPLSCPRQWALGLALFFFFPLFRGGSITRDSLHVLNCSNKFFFLLALDGPVPHNFGRKQNTNFEESKKGPRVFRQRYFLHPSKNKLVVFLNY